MNESYEELYDHGEPRGRLEILLHRTRWRWIIGGIIGLSFVIPFVIVHLTTSADDIGPNETDAMHLLFKAAPQQQPEMGISSSVGKGKGRSPSNGASSRGNNGKAPKSSSISTSTDYTAKGDSPTVMKNFTDFPGLSACSGNSSRLTSVCLSNFYLDAGRFSQSLEGCSTLESISLDNIWLIGNFTRVTLPNLKRFVYVQNGGDTRDSYKSPESLQQTLFFDRVPPTDKASWSVSDDLLNLGVDITLSKGGTKLIDIRRQQGEIYLNVKYCEETLVNVKGSYDSLTLINCNVTTASLPAIPGTLKYLNIRNSIQRTPQLADLLRKQTLLKELYLWLTFHCDWPGYELFLNLNDLPSTITKLGMNNADSTFTPGGSTTIKTLTIGDYTTPSTISEGLPSLFPHLERINIVNMSDPSPSAGYSAIYQAIQMKVKEIAVVNLHRNYSTAIEYQEELLQVENTLDQAGIQKQAVSCFILQLNQVNSSSSTAHYAGRELSVQERHQVRYEGLGFDKMDSLEDYLKWDSLA